MDHAARAKRALEGLLYSPGRGVSASDKDSDAVAAAAAAAGDAALFSTMHEQQDAEVAPKARPWEREDLWRRLRTFRAGSWFCKPPPAGPVECARRGWVNAGQDLLSCEFCKAKLSFSLPISLPQEEAAKATEAFVEQLAAKHAGDCPWRATACAPELAAFPPLPSDAVRSGFSARCAAFDTLDQLPPLAPAAQDAMSASHREQLEALLREGPQQPPQRAPLSRSVSGLLADPAAESLDPEPDTPAAPMPRRSSPAQSLAAAAAAGLSAGAMPAQNGSAVAGAGAGAGLAAGGDEAPAAAAGKGAGVAPAGSEEFARRRRLLSLAGWHAVPVPFGAVSPGAAAALAAQADGTDPSAETLPPGHQHQEQLPAGQAVVFCRLCGAKHGLWSFLGADSPDLSAARRFRLPSSVSRGVTALAGTPARPGAPASAPSKLQAGRGGAAASTPVAWRGFGSPQLHGRASGNGGNGSGTRPQLVTIAGGQLGSLHPAGGFGSVRAAPSGSSNSGSGAAPAASTALTVPFGSRSRDAPVFGTPARSPRPSPLSGAGAAAIAATIAGGTTPARLPFAASDAVAVDAGGRGPVTSAAKPAYGTLGQPQQQPFAAANGTSGSTSSGGGQQALHDGVAAGTSRGEAPPQPSEAAKAKSPFGAGAASAPVFGIAAMRSPSLGTPKSANAASAGAAAATHKRGRDDAEPQAGEAAVPAKRPRTSQPLPDAPAAATASGGAAAGDAAAADAAATDVAATALSVAALDPLKLHRPFCPWVKWHEAGGARRCGWAWSLDALVPPPDGGGFAAAEGAPRDRASLVMSLLKKVGVRR